MAANPCPPAGTRVELHQEGVAVQPESWRWLVTYGGRQPDGTCVLTRVIQRAWPAVGQRAGHDTEQGIQPDACPLPTSPVRTHDMSEQRREFCRQPGLPEIIAIGRFVQPAPSKAPACGLSAEGRPATAMDAAGGCWWLDPATHGVRRYVPNAGSTPPASASLASVPVGAR